MTETLKTMAIIAGIAGVIAAGRMFPTTSSAEAATVMQQVPKFRAEGSWPKLPSKWIMAIVSSTAIDEQETALLHLGTHTYFSLNVTGARIWQHLKAGLSVTEVSARLQQEFAVDSARAEQSVLRLVEELVHHRLAHRA